MHITLTMGLVIALALAFDFTNGFHDAANSVATVVATRALPPFLAVLWAAVFNFAAFWFFGLKVASTIAKGVVDQNALSVSVVFSGLMGAIVWNLVTFWLGLPSSSSHALVGGIAGGAVAQSGFSSLQSAGIEKILVFIVLSPMIGLALGFIIHLVLLWGSSWVKKPKALHRSFRLGELVSSAALSLGHGANDAQKTMGLILAVLIGGGALSKGASVPTWVVLSCYAMISLGTLTGGWRIIKTLGSRITQLTPAGGVAAQSGSALTLFMASAAGIPVSTTHTVTGAIVGVGMSERFSAVRWMVARRITLAWVLTIPGAFLVALVSQLIIRGVG